MALLRITNYHLISTDAAFYCFLIFLLGCPWPFIASPALDRSFMTHCSLPISFSPLCYWSLFLSSKQRLFAATPSSLAADIPQGSVAFCVVICNLSDSKTWHYSLLRYTVAWLLLTMCKHIILHWQILFIYLAALPRLEQRSLNYGFWCVQIITPSHRSDRIHCCEPYHYMEEFRSNCFVLGHHPWVSILAHLPFIQALSGPQRTSETPGFILEAFRHTGLVYQEQSLGQDGMWKQKDYCVAPVQAQEDKGSETGTSAPWGTTSHS